MIDVSTPLALVLGLSHHLIADIARETDALHLLPSVFFAMSLTDISILLSSAMTQQNKYACLAGRDAIIGHYVTQYVRSINAWSPCANGRQCADGALGAFCIPPLVVATTFIILQGCLGGIVCAECKQKLVSLAETLTQSIWDDLPAMFGLPPWAELLNNRA